MTASGKNRNIKAIAITSHAFHPKAEICFVDFAGLLARPQFLFLHIPLEARQWLFLETVTLLPFRGWGSYSYGDSTGLSACVSRYTGFPF